MNMGSFGLTPEDLAAVKEMNSVVKAADALTEEELSDLEAQRLTIGLMIKAKRLIGLKAALASGKLNEIFVEKKQLEYFVTRKEIEPLEDSCEFAAQMMYAIFKALERKNILTVEDIQQDSLTAGDSSGG